MRSLGETALKRYSKLKPTSKSITDKVVEIRKTNGGAILDQDDLVKEVLDDNEFVTVGMRFLYY